MRITVLQRSVSVPIEAGQQILVMHLAGQSGGSLLLGFMGEGSFNGPPRLLEVELFSY